MFADLEFAREELRQGTFEFSAEERAIELHKIRSIGKGLLEAFKAAETTKELVDLSNAEVAQCQRRVR